ncbi:MAG: DUF2189 domain-containing protein [Pseudomonadota bacterium]
MTDTYAPPPIPKIKPVTPEIIRTALSRGIEDFRAAPQFGLFFGAIYALGGAFMIWVLAQVGASWMIIPLAIGFPLLGPFVAVGLYEVSRRRQRGEPLEWGPILFVIRDQTNRQLGWMSLVILFMFWIWVYQVRLLLALFLGMEAFLDPAAFLAHIVTSSEGIAFLLVGTLIGAVLTCVIFSLTVVSMPLLLDRDIDVVTAMIVSVQTVVANPQAMLSWGVVIAGATLIAMLPAFLGLLIMLPILGHATWHLYTQLVEPV